jgi:hypothetical protein
MNTNDLRDNVRPLFAALQSAHITRPPRNVCCTGVRRDRRCIVLNRWGVSAPESRKSARPKRDIDDENGIAGATATPYPEHDAGRDHRDLSEHRATTTRAAGQVRDYGSRRLRQGAMSHIRRAPRAVCWNALPRRCRCGPLNKRDIATPPRSHAWRAVVS